MTIPDIRYYDARRKKPNYVAGADREPNGRIRRYAQPDEHMVYFVRIESLPKVKIGRTSNIARRIAEYRRGSGCEPFCVAQMLVNSAADAASLERTAIDLARIKYERSLNEWFDIPDSQLANLMSEVISKAKVEILEVRGMPGAEKEVSAFGLEVEGPMSRVTNRRLLRTAVRFRA